MTAIENYHIEVFHSWAEVDPVAWNELLVQQDQPTPFLRHDFFAAAEASGSACESTGWAPRIVVLSHDGIWAAACATYLKTHSYGEYVFDWAWADAHRRHGLAYYPKLLAASPFSPIPGSRLMARNDADRLALARALTGLAQGWGLSSAHALFTTEVDQAALSAAGWMTRRGVQFHWQADDSQSCADFDEHLARLQRHKRKNIAQERRKVREAGIGFEILEGSGIGAEQWDFFHACYCQTYAEHGSSPYLTRDFFARLARNQPEHWLMFIARDNEGRGEPVGASLVAIDRARGHAWGRYWGALRHIPCLHFEACYYQPLAWCMSQGFRRFEGGAQGEHKMARGLMPVETASMHWLADPRFATAIDDFLQREGSAIGDYLNELEMHSPFK